MKTIQFKFVEYIPSELEESVLYISIEYKTAVHKCVCGCGNKVVTPLTPNDWEIIYDGKTVSLSPSIGNWNFKCKSHYFITKNRVRFATLLSDWEIEDGRKEDVEKKKKYYKKIKLNEYIFFKQKVKFEPYIQFQWLLSVRIS